MATIRRYRASLAIALAVVLGGCSIIAATPTPSVTSTTLPIVRTENLTALTVTGPGQFNSDGSAIAVRITGKQGSSAQLLTVEDFNKIPIFVVPPAGGPAVFGDQFRMFSPGNVFEPSLILWMDGSITLGGTQPGGSRQGGVTLYSGSADPREAPPGHLGHSFTTGDRYFRSDGTDWVYVGNAWTMR